MTTTDRPEAAMATELLRAELQASALLCALRPFAKAYAGVRDLRDDMGVVFIGDTHLRVTDFRRASEAIAACETQPAQSGEA